MKLFCTTKSLDAPRRSSSRANPLLNGVPFVLSRRRCMSSESSPIRIRLHGTSQEPYLSVAPSPLAMFRLTLRFTGTYPLLRVILYTNTFALSEQRRCVMMNYLFCYTTITWPLRANCHRKFCHRLSCSIVSTSVLQAHSESS